jgi:hypothetical protein
MRATRFPTTGACIGFSLALAIGGATACAVPAAPGNPETRRTAAAPLQAAGRDLDVGDPTLRPRAVVEPNGRDIFRERAATAPPPPVAPVPFPQRSSIQAASDERTDPGAPRLVLAGIAEDGDGSTDASRTAIVSGAGDLWMVRRGELVAGRYRVERVEADAVHLGDTRGGPPLVLRLR